MNLPSHSITPSDNRDAPRPKAAHPANVASREHSAQALNLALQIADAEVQGLVESYSPAIMDGGYVWCDTSKPPEDMLRFEEDRQLALSTTARAVRYIGLRHPDSFPWRFVRHPERPELVRFEKRA